MLYRLVGQCKNGVKVEGYIIEDQSNNRNYIPKQELERLVMLKKVVNAHGQLYNGKFYIKGKNCKLTDLPILDCKGNLIPRNGQRKVTPYMRIIKRVVKGKDTIAYQLEVKHNENGNIESGVVPRETVLQFAETGVLINARVQKDGGKSILRGVNCDLSKLPIVRV